MKRIGFTGSFDPITKGHLWVLEQGLEIADKVILMIAVNPAKKYMFSEQERKDMIYESLVEYGIQDKVDIVLVRNEYVAQSALDYDCQYLIRGIRSSVDYDYESLIEKANTEVLCGAKTLFLLPPRDLASVSSSFIKSFIGPIGWHWHVKKFVSHAVYDALIKQYLRICVEKYTGLNLSKEKLNEFVDMVIQKYKDRPYHNMDHIIHCFEELEWFLNNSEEKMDVSDVALAIIAHDIIYGAKQAESDEELSAKWLKDYLNELGVERPNAVEIVLSTAHFLGKYPVNTPEKELMSSIDLAILGQQEDIYDKYTQGVRKEYSFVNDLDYAKGRIQAMDSLMKNKLYLTKVFEKYEEKAKRNVQKEKNKLYSYLNEE